MKKFLFAALMLCCASITSNAQLKVNADGNVIIDGHLEVQQQYLSPTFPAKTGWTTSYSFNAATLLSNLMPFRYTSGLQPANYTAHYGLTASSMSLYAPELTTTDGSGNTIVNYVELVPVLVKAVQENSASIVALSSKISDLEDNSASFMAGSAYGKNSEENADNKLLSDRFIDAVLYQNSPNPFTSQTEVRYRLPEDAQDAYIYVFDMSGKTVKQVALSATEESITINAYDLSSGLYLYSLVVGGQEVDCKRMILSK